MDHAMTRRCVPGGRGHSVSTTGPRLEGAQRREPAAEAGSAGREREAVSA
jgi:hypothetical protein